MLSVLVAVVGGLLPTSGYVVFVWWLDRYEKEPFWLLASAFLWGALPAAILSLLLEVLFDLPLAVLGSGSLAANLISTALAAPLVEESCKGLALIGLVLLFRREFDDELDGFVYGALIGFGFALTENLFAYYLPIVSEAGIAAGAGNLLLRSIVFGINHALWSGIMGMAVGAARLARGPGRQALLLLGGWFLAATMHGLHNAGASLTEQSAGLCLLANVALDWGGMSLLLLAAVLVLRKESRWIERGLLEEVRRQSIGEAEYHLLRSAGRRLSRRWSAWRQGGREAQRAVARYFQCATELAFAKQHLRSEGDRGANLDRVQRLREELASLRDLAAPWLT